MNKKRVLVTGGAGFIGSHLCKRLVSEGHHVICIDDLSTGQLENIELLQKSPQFTFIQHDISIPLPQDIVVDEIYNLASPASPPRYVLIPLQTMRTNVLGAMHVLDLAKKHTARILQASTSEVYGDPEVHPQPESYRGNVNPNGIRACYDEAKRCVEAIFCDYQREHGVDIRIIRIFNTYGPHMHPDDGRVVSNFIMQALTNQDITIYGDGSQTRSFQYVDDLLEGMVRMMNNDTGFSGPVNLGNPDEFTIKELAEKVLAHIPESTSKLIYEELPSDDPRQRKPDITLAKSKLDWQPTIALDEGLVKTIEFFRQKIAK